MGWQAVALVGGLLTLLVGGLLALVVRSVRAEAKAKAERRAAEGDFNAIQKADDVGALPGPADSMLGEYWKRLRRRE